MLRHRAILILLLAAAAALPAGARLRAALGPDGRAGRRELFRGHWERAAQAFQRAVDSGPPASGYPTPGEFEGLGYAWLKARRYGDAARAYQRLCAMSPDKAQFWVNVGIADAYQQPAHLEEAEAAFRHACQLRPRDPDALVNLAVVLHKQGHPAEALPLAQQAADIDARKAYILTELGEIQLDLSHYADAYRAFQRALARDRSWPPTRLGLAGLFYARGLYADAVRCGREFLNRTDSDPERWADERVRAQSLIQQAQMRLRSEPGEDNQPPQLSFLSPRLSTGPGTRVRVGGAVVSLSEDQDQFGILGVVQDDRGVK